MLFRLTNPEEEGSRIFGWAAAAMLTLAVLALVPPGTLPGYRDAAEVPSDAVLQHWPNAYHLRQSVLEHGALPLWYPHHMLGQPFAANPLAKVWYPPQWLVVLLPPTAHLNLMLYGHMLLLAFGMLRWARLEGLTAPAAAFAALTWGLNSKLIAHLGAGHLDIFYALAWLPWLLHAAARLAGQPSAGQVAACAIFGALTVLADVRIGFFGLMLAAAYALLIGWQHGRLGWGYLPKFGALTTVLMGLLLAVQIVPLLAVQRYLTRGSLTAEAAAIDSLPPVHAAAGLLLGNVNGYHEFATYVGLPVLILSVMLLGRLKSLEALRRQRSVFWAAICIAAALWAMGRYGPLYLPTVNLMPALAWLRVPSRAWFISAFALSILGAYGLDSLIRHPRWAWGNLTAAATAGAGLIWLMVVMLRGLPPLFMVSGLTLLGTGIGLAGLSQQGVWRRVPVWAAASLILVTNTAALGAVGRTYLAGMPAAAADPTVEAVIETAGDNCGRYYIPDFSLIGPALVSQGVSTLNGVDPFSLNTSTGRIFQAAGQVYEGYQIAVPRIIEGVPSAVDYDLMAGLGVQTLVLRAAVDDPGLMLRGQAGDYFIYRLAVSEADRSACPAHPNRAIDARIEAPAQGRFPVVVASSQAWLPGWRAYVDGAPVPVVPVDGLWAGVALTEPGPQQVLLAYRPLADYIGMAITAVTVLGLLMWWLGWGRFQHA